MNSRQRRQWLGAMDKERKSLQKHAAHALVPITSVPTVRSSALASCLNRKQTVSSRLDKSSKAMSYVQGPGIDYGKSFASVCRLGSHRLSLAIACELRCA